MLKLKEIVPNFFLVQGHKNGRFPFSHSILLLNDKKHTMLIDTGCGLDFLQDLIHRYQIKRVINSHTHPDHTAGNYLFNRKNIPIVVPTEALQSAGNLNLLAQRFASPRLLQREWIHFVTSNMGINPYIVNQTYNKETNFEFGDFSIQPIYAPGHTVDHYCFFEKNYKILISSDYDLTRFGPWYGHLESSIVQTLSSLEKIKLFHPEIFVSSHLGIVQENIESKIDQFAEVINSRDKKLLKLIEKTSITEADLVKQKPFYQTYPYAPNLMQYWESQMITKHIKRLIVNNKIERDPNGLLSLK
ncbi:MAG: hypothetical protein DRO88_09970 [Promethearchaeia archaeon]|nr:MAG: hypothetical protein DRO88_09970 [Candidatus Lokiarchaeia archaeon]